jgi:hypothetical protein
MFNSMKLPCPDMSEVGFFTIESSDFRYWVRRVKLPATGSGMSIPRFPERAGEQNDY